MTKKERGYTSAKAKEVLLKDKDKFCGECCWFYGEKTDGWGFCVHLKDMCDGSDFKVCSDLCTTDEYVSRQEMRHHMAVLLQYNRWLTDWIGVKRYCPDRVDLMDATEFAYKYMKIFGEL